ncbi:MAG: hypothetical protein K1X78_01305 [Verrucomicrobiaceae bacterium]|nr:hypothetical protein [Verrucomicrobiaceae bacterium]
MKTKSGKPMRICFDRIIPATMPEARHLARRHDIHLARLGAPNAREVLADIDPDAPGPIGGRRMALINSRKWDNGSTLRCRFLEGSKKQQEAVIRHAKEWMKYANINIEFVKSGAAEVRIAFKDDGSWSAIGRDALVESYFPKHGSTMNFGWIFDNTADAVSRAVVLHEFGHALGCIHEHQSPKQTLKWNKQKVYEVFSGSPNYWSKEEIDSNVLQKYSAKGTSATIFDPDSIMLYQFDSELFTNGKATHENTELSALDIKMIGEMYPGVKPPKAAAESGGGRRASSMAVVTSAAAPSVEAGNVVVRFFWEHTPLAVRDRIGDPRRASWAGSVLRLRMHQTVLASRAAQNEKQIKARCLELVTACENAGASYEPGVTRASALAMFREVLGAGDKSVDDVLDAVEACYEF